MSSSPSPSSFYEIVEKDANGNDVSFETFRGKVVYGVNVASRCGYTSSGYALISRLSALKSQGLEVALFPCNQFGAQEPGSDEQIKSFCAAKGAQDVHLFAKADVNGANTRPTYRYLKSKGVFGDITWNFAGKFVIDRAGNAHPVKSEKELEQLIDSLLKQSV